MKRTKKWPYEEENEKYSRGYQRSTAAVAQGTQVVYLDFDGTRTSYRGELLTMDEVVVEDSGLEAERIASIVLMLNGLFAERRTVFVAGHPAGGGYSTVYIGKSDAFAALGNIRGIAETVDSGNRNRSDNAFVLLDAESSDATIVDTIAHEVSHLLGESHGGDGITQYLADPEPASMAVTISDGDRIDPYDGEISLAEAVSVYAVSSGTISFDSALNGTPVVYSGAFRQPVYKIIISGNGASKTILQAVSGGSLIIGGETQFLDLYDATLQGAIINSSGFLKISGGGVVSDTTVNSGGWLTVISGGVADGVTQEAWGVINHSVYGGDSDTYISGVHNGSDHFMLSGGTASGFFVYNGLGQVIFSGGTAIDTTVFDSQAIYSGGVASGTTVKSGAYLGIASGGVADGVTQEVDGMINHSVYGGDSATYISGIHNGSDRFMLSGGTASGFFLYGHTTQIIYSGGTALDTLVDYNCQQVISSGGVASDTFIDLGGMQNISSDGVASNTTLIGSTAQQIVDSGGVANNTTINSGGRQSLAGVASNTTINQYGTQYIYSDGVAIDTNVADGSQEISAGGVASNTHIGYGAQNIYSGGTAINTTAYGNQVIYSGGVASDTIVFSRQFIKSGGIIEGNNVIAGFMSLEAGAVTSDATVILDLSGRTPAYYVMINDLTLLANGINAIRISGTILSGTYDLADGYSATDSLDIAYEGGSDAIGGFRYLTANSRYSGAANGDSRYTLTSSGTVLQLYAHERYEVLVYANTEYIAEDTSYTDLRTGSSAGIHAKLTSGNTYARSVYGGGSSAAVGGSVALDVESGATLTGNLFGGGLADVGSVKLQFASAAATGALYGGGQSGGAVTGDVGIVIDGGAIRALAGGGADSLSRVGGGIDITIGNAATGAATSVTGAVYGGGCGDVGGGISVTVESGAVFTSQVYFGSLCTGGATTSVGDGITVALNGGDFTGSTNLSFGSRVSKGAHTVYGGIEVTVAAAFSASNAIYAGGYLYSTGASDSALTVTDGVNILWTGGTMASGAPATGKGLYLGAFAAVGTATVEGGTAITVENGSLTELYGGGFAQGNGASIVRGGVSITVGGGTIGAIFGGGAYASTGGTSQVDGDVDIVIAGGTIGNVHGGGRYAADTVSGDVRVTVSGSAGVTGVISGIGASATDNVGGTSTLTLSDYTGGAGEFGGTVNGFDTLAFSGSTAIKFTADMDLTLVSAWEFDLTDRAENLADTSVFDWRSGENSFAGDRFEIRLTSDQNSVSGWDLYETDSLNGTLDDISSATFKLYVEDVGYDLTFGVALAEGVYSGWGVDLFNEESGNVLRFSQLV